MAEKPSDTKKTEDKSFAQFLSEEPAPAETVTLAGYVARSPRPEVFVLTTGGQNIEIPVEAVQSFRVLNEGPQKLVELQVQSAKIDTSRVYKHPGADSPTQKNPYVDQVFTFKEMITDPLVDKGTHTDPIVDRYSEPQIPDPTSAFASAANNPFVLATPHHAPAEALATQMGGAATTQLTTVTHDIATSVYVDAQTTSIYADTGNTSVYVDPPHTSVYADPGGNTSVYLDPPHTSVYADAKTNPYLDNIQTLKEVALDPIQPPTFDPQLSRAATAQMDPAAAAAANQAMQAQLAPQTNLTSVYADQILTSVYADTQTSVYADAGNTSVYADPPTSVYADTQTSVYADTQTSVYADHPHTIKELIKDPIRDVITGPVWNLPGMMF